ncbi:CYTH domain-containing protein [Crenobacter intestini]|uniref:CYTH domain-containing protein n=1 Tax=Crenobacter intestini TaxID=2563443 RepID=A0A4T0UP70_9NEIS|nr:CYTH domain-containing protein [Crenobacter intestini]TIC80584.1 CYTH domain-containing protein [Crenobacter intestini]
MAVEIERRFLVQGDGWRGGADGVRLRQGFMAADAVRSVRVRIAGGEAWLTIKAEATAVARAEFEYPLPLADAEHMLAQLCVFSVDKWRYHLEYGGREWTVDEYGADGGALVIAEIELPDATTDFPRPPWLGNEVTTDARYSYGYLLRHHCFGGSPA